MHPLGFNGFNDKYSPMITIFMWRAYLHHLLNVKSGTYLLWTSLPHPSKRQCFWERFWIAQHLAEYPVLEGGWLMVWSISSISLPLPCLMDISFVLPCLETGWDRLDLFFTKLVQQNGMHFLFTLLNIEGMNIMFSPHLCMSVEYL